MLPLGCLPLWGKEGVTLIAFPKEWRATGFLQSPPIIFFWLTAEHLDILCKVIYPQSHLSFQVNGRRKALLDIHPLFTFN